MALPLALCSLRRAFLFPTHMAPLWKRLVERKEASHQLLPVPCTPGTPARVQHGRGFLSFRLQCPSRSPHLQPLCFHRNRHHRCSRSLPLSFLKKWTRTRSFTKEGVVRRSKNMALVFFVNRQGFSTELLNFKQAVGARVSLLACTLICSRSSPRRGRETAKCPKRTSLRTGDLGVFRFKFLPPEVAYPPRVAQLLLEQRQWYVRGCVKDLVHVIEEWCSSPKEVTVCSPSIFYSSRVSFL